MKRLLAAALVLLSGCASVAPEPARLVGGRGPVVALQSGLGDGVAAWNSLLPDLERDHRLYAYDRAHYEGPRDPCSIARDLRARLRAAGLPPPYLLLGHSLGGLYQYAFARLYPEEVAGLLLLDPTHPRHWETLQASAPEAAALIRALKTTVWPARLAREFEQQSECLDALPPPPSTRPPARVLVSGRPDALAPRAFQARLDELRRNWPALLGSGTVETVWESGHYLQRERPDAVAAALRALANRPPLPPLHPGGADHPDLRVGVSTAEQVRAALGEPREIHPLDEGAVWVHGGNHQGVLLALSLLPVIGDLADAWELLERARGRQEWIVRLDAAGVARRITRRELER